MNLFTNRPAWLFRALGLTDPNVPQHLATDQVVPVVDIAQSGWASAQFFSARINLDSAVAAAVGPSAFPLNNGGVRLADDEGALILGASYFNSTAGAVNLIPWVSGTTPRPPADSIVGWGVYALGAGNTHYQGQAPGGYSSINSFLPFYLPPGYGFGDLVGTVGVFLNVYGVKLPKGVKPL